MFSGRGNYYRRKRVVTVEQVAQIDLRYLKAEKVLEQGCSGVLSWRSGDKSIGSVSYRITASHMELLYVTAGINRQQLIEFAFTPCHYGGYRKWFRCPGCQKRVIALYGYGGYFECRQCHQLAYSSSNESKRGRVLLKKHKLGQAIFQSYDQGRGWGKKHGLHWETFSRLKMKYDHLERYLDQ